MSAYNISSERQIFELLGHQISHANTVETQQLLADAHGARVRPLCMCKPGGVAMYVAKIGRDKFVIKRMPDSGLAHAHRCPSYLPPEALSGLGQVLGAAITSEGDGEMTAVRLGFRMSKSERAAPTGQGTGIGADSVAGDANRLSMRA